MEPVSAPTRLCVNSCFDSGNIICKSATDPSNIQLEIRPDPYCDHDKVSHFQWFHFRITGARNVPLTINLVNAAKASFPEAWPGVIAYLVRVGDVVLEAFLCNFGEQLPRISIQPAHLNVLCTVQDTRPVPRMTARSFSECQQAGSPYLASSQ